MKTLFTQFVLLFLVFTAFSQTDGWTVYDETNSSIPFDKVFYLEFDHNGNLWGGTSVTNQTAHLFMFDGINFVNHNKSKWVYDIKVDTNGNIWTLNSNSEISKYDGAGWTDIKNADLGWYSSPLYIDANDNKWANPLFSGTLLKYDGSNWTTYNNGNTGIPDNKINCISGEGSNIYFGTNDSGLIHFDGTNWTTFSSSNSSLPSNRIYASCMDTYDSLWLFCGDGYLVSIKDGDWTVYSDPLFDLSTSAIDFDKDGNLWIAQSTRVLKFDKRDITEYNSTNSPLPQFSILTVKVDLNNRVWIGTRTGLFSYKDNIDTTITISLQPQGLTVNKGEYVEFSLEAKGEKLMYQWQKDGIDIKYATTTKCQIASAKTSDEGKYSCIVKNDWGQVVSEEAELIVKTGSYINSSLAESRFSIYPNPNQGNFHIAVPPDFYGDIEIQIYNLNGQLINAFQYSINTFQSSIDVNFSNQPKGLYILHVCSDGEHYRRIFSSE